MRRVLFLTFSNISDIFSRTFPQPAEVKKKTKNNEDLEEYRESLLLRFPEKLHWRARRWPWAHGRANILPLNSAASRTQIGLLT